LKPRFAGGHGDGRGAVAEPEDEQFGWDALGRARERVLHRWHGEI
jgi:hypothetical protein